MKSSKKSATANTRQSPPEAVAPTPEPVEGEGSYSAARRYDAGVADTVASGDVEELAQRAKRAMEGGEAHGLRVASEAAKRGVSVPAPKRRPR